MSDKPMTAKPMTAHELAAILAAGPNLEVYLALKCHGCHGDALRVEVEPEPYPGVCITDYLDGER